ncbi:hypothetical protein [Bradyrhizobium japonicum]|nr:hypothetical protein [Bradyrhizobium japonicum]
MTNDAALTRRRSNNPHEETWHIFSDDVRIGTIGVRAGVPVHADQWGWSVGFYPSMEPATGRRGIAATFEAAREAFETAWSELQPSVQCLRRMALRSRLAGGDVGQARAWREAR